MLHRFTRSWVPVCWSVPAACALRPPTPPSSRHARIQIATRMRLKAKGSKGSVPASQAFGGNVRGKCRVATASSTRRSVTPDFCTPEKRLLSSGNTVRRQSSLTDLRLRAHRDEAWSPHAPTPSPLRRLQRAARFVKNNTCVTQRLVVHVKGQSDQRVPCLEGSTTFDDVVNLLRGRFAGLADLNVCGLTTTRGDTLEGEALVSECCSDGDVCVSVLEPRPHAPLAACEPVSSPQGAPRVSCDDVDLSSTGLPQLAQATSTTDKTTVPARSKLLLQGATETWAVPAATRSSESTKANHAGVDAVLTPTRRHPATNNAMPMLVRRWPRNCMWHVWECAHYCGGHATD